MGRVNTAAGRALQGLVQSGQIKDGAHIKITDANRGHLAALLGDAKNVRVAGDVQSLRAAVGDPNVELHGGGYCANALAPVAAATASETPLAERPTVSFAPKPKTVEPVVKEPNAKEKAKAAAKEKAAAKAKARVAELALAERARERVRERREQRARSEQAKQAAP